MYPVNLEAGTEIKKGVIALLQKNPKIVCFSIFIALLLLIGGAGNSSVTENQRCANTNDCSSANIYEDNEMGRNLSSTSYLGDLNHDGKIDISDVILALRVALKLDDLKPCSDINSDCIIDISDVILILRVAIKIDQPKYCQEIEYRLYGINFSPYMTGQDPNLRTYIEIEQIRKRMCIIAPYTHRVRTFGTADGLEKSGMVAHEFGLEAFIGAWLSKDLATNEEQIEKLIQAGKDGYIDVAIVGNEVLLRQDLSEDQLINYIRRVKNALPGIPVTTADVYSKILSYPRIIEEVDFLFVNYYPYWEGIKVDYAIATIHTLHKRMIEAANGKEVYVSETGWPSCGNTIGEAVPSPENASFYFLNFVSWARANNIKYFYFEAFDEEWKANYEGPQGKCWGIWDKDGNLKNGMQDVFDGLTIPDNWTCTDIVGGPGNPKIEFTYVPPYGSFDNIKGQVWHVTPDKYKVVVYIYVAGNWWIKPYLDKPLTNINCDGTWTTDITTGGIDERATKIIAYLIPAGYNPPLSYNKLELEQNSVSWVEVSRIPL